jgi:GNAT superfamily N-acetyltransferase
MGDEANYRVSRADESSWDDVRRLFGPAGADNGCWCQYWLLGSEYRKRDRSLNRDDLAEQVRAERAGLLAREGDEPVGWARFTNRSELAWLTSRFSAYGFADEDPLTLSCFFVSRRARGTGVMKALIEFAVASARESGASIEAYPIDVSIPGATQNRFPGVLAPFLDAGFVETGRLSDDRVVVRSEYSRN